MLNHLQSFTLQGFTVTFLEYCSVCMKYIFYSNKHLLELNQTAQSVKTTYCTVKLHQINV